MAQSVMAFRDGFLGYALPINERSLRGIEGGFELSEQLLRSLREAIRSYLECSLERVAESHANSSFLAEILSRVQSFEKLLKPAEEAAKSQEKAASELAATIQRHCEYLGTQFFALRWAMERHVSEKTVKFELSAMEASDRRTFERGAQHYDLKQLDLARVCFNAVLAANPSDCFAHQYLGFIGVYENDPSEAASHFEQAYKQAPDDRQRALALSHTARMQFVLGRLDLAADLGRAAAQAFQESAGLWYEYATYASILGDAVTGLRALTKAMQLDWMYWTIAAADPALESVRPHLVSLMDGIRQSVSQKTRAALDRLAIVIDAAAGAFGEEYMADIQQRQREFEERYSKNNIYFHRDLLSEAENWRGRVLSAARETVRHKIGVRTGALRGTDANKEVRIAQLREPIDKLKSEQQRIRARFKPWEVGFGTYSLMWLAYVLMTFALLRELEWNDLYVIPYLLSFVVPFLVPLTFNEIKRRREVDKPVQQLERRIRSLAREVRPAVSQIEREHLEQKKKLEIELKELEILRETLAGVE